MFCFVCSVLFVLLLFCSARVGSTASFGDYWCPRSLPRLPAFTPCGRKGVRRGGQALAGAPAAQLRAAPRSDQCQGARGTPAASGSLRLGHVAQLDALERTHSFCEPWVFTPRRTRQAPTSSSPPWTGVEYHAYTLPSGSFWRQNFEAHEPRRRRPTLDEGYTGRGVENGKCSGWAVSSWKSYCALRR